MAGSCGMQFARVATRQGIVSRAPARRWGFEHLRYRLRGTTDERTAEVLRAARELIRGVPVRRHRADGPGGDGGDPAARLPADARRGPRPPGRRPRRPSSSAPPATAWSSAGRTCSAWTAGSAPATRSMPTATSPAASRVPSSTAPGKVEAMQAFAAEHDIDLPTPTPTPTRSRICRCWGRWAIRSPSTPTRRWPRSPAARAGRRCASSASAADWSAVGGARCWPTVAGLAVSRGARAVRRSRAGEGVGPDRVRRPRLCDGRHHASVATYEPREPSDPPEREAEFSTISGEPIEPLYTERRTRRPRRGRSACRASIRSPAGPIRRCTGAGSGRCASSPVSAPPRRPTSASTTCSTHGQTGLSTAFDMPTLMGYDSDHPRSLGEVGREGVAVDTLDDMEQLFAGIPLGGVTTSMTINAPAAILLAFYVVVGEQQGVPPEKLGGHDPDRHPQGVHRPEGVVLPDRAGDAAGHRHDRVVLAEHAALAPGLDLRLPHPRGRLDRRSRSWPSRSRTASPTSSGRSSGASTSTSSPPASRFFFNAHIDFFEEIAKYRAARRIWAREMRDTYGASARSRCGCASTPRPRASR